MLESNQRPQIKSLLLIPSANSASSNFYYRITRHCTRNGESLDSAFAAYNLDNLPIRLIGVTDLVTFRQQVALLVVNNHVGAPGFEPRITG